MSLLPDIVAQNEAAGAEPLQGLMPDPLGLPARGCTVGGFVASFKGRGPKLECQHSELCISSSVGGAAVAVCVCLCAPAFSYFDGQLQREIKEGKTSSSFTLLVPLV